MSNKKVFREQDIIRLLEHWRSRNYPYSSVFQSKRRSAFLAAGASFLLHGAGGAIRKSVSRAGHADAPMTIGMKITLGVLYTVILASSLYLGLTYYKDIVAWIDRMQSRPTPTLVAPLPGAYLTEPNLGTITIIPTITVSPTGTLTPTPIPTTSNQPKQPTTYISTPTSPGQPTRTAMSTPTKPGWHYGKTKTPKPTKPPKPITTSKSKQDFIHFNINQKQGKLWQTLWQEVACIEPACRINYDPWRHCETVLEAHMGTCQVFFSWAQSSLLRNEPFQQPCE
jgi:hypothetical protein